MKGSGKARLAAYRIVVWTTALLLALFGGGYWLFGGQSWWLWMGLALWVGSIAFTLYFFRAPHAKVPEGDDVIVAPAYGKVDVIEQCRETSVLGGECQRVSIFLSIFDVHIQRAPIHGKLTHWAYTPGGFRNALDPASAASNENLLLGFGKSTECEEPIAVRLIAGLIARRIVPWIEKGDLLKKGELMSLIRFGSRCDIYLPLSATIEVSLGQRVKGGESVLARATHPDGKAT